jgi:hypothetical protein
MAELGVNSDDKSGNTPMFETIVPSSFAGTTCRTIPSTRLMYSLVSSIRVPVGAFTLITNWPASVRGKNETPIKGTNRKLRANAPIIAATVNRG